jgi:hypothetical protein
VQELDAALVEELKAKAAAEEEMRTASASVDPEADPRRFNFHRVLMNAANRGLPEEAEEALGQMAAAGLTPGPRAYHALAFAYIRSKQAYDALNVAKRAVEAGGA